MNRDQIERAERRAEMLDARRGKMTEARQRRVKRVEALAEASQWKRPKSLSNSSRRPVRQRVFEFTDEQMEIAMRSLERNG